MGESKTGTWYRFACAPFPNPCTPSTLTLSTLVPCPRQDLAKAAQAVKHLAQQLARSRASESEARRESAQAVSSASAAADAAASAKSDLETIRAREEISARRLRMFEETAAGQREGLERELKAVREACNGLRKLAGAAEEEAKRELGRVRVKLAEIVAKKDEMVGHQGSG